MAKRVRLDFNLNEGDSVASGVFFEEALRRDLRRFLAESWPSSAKLEGVDPGWSSTDARGGSAIFELGSGGLAFIHIGFGTAFAQVAAKDDEDARAGLEEMRALFPRSQREEDRVPVTFWTYSPHGPSPMRRLLSVPPWQEIAQNYTGETRAALEPLMGGDFPMRGGQLLLWHGETGTGKTTALRALAREWSNWCDVHYIVDPEKFFGERADYMISVMFEEEPFGEDEDEEFTTFHATSAFEVRVRSSAGDGERKNAWRLLVLEDTGELLAADARLTAGQGLSRFLNVVDGLIGQGLRILVLVTTNEEIGKLHPAVARPGRCAADVLFRPLPLDEASGWLREHGYEGRASGAMTLAALYALVEGWDAVAERQAVGFG